MRSKARTTEVDETDTLVAGISSAIPEHVTLAALDDRVQREKRCRPSVTVIITRFAIRRLDPSNLDAKALLDCLRNCGLIEDDDEDSINFEIHQVKVHKVAHQGTKIEITYE